MATKTIRKLITLDGVSSLSSIFGVQDKNLKFLEKELGVDINIESEGIAVTGPQNNVRTAKNIIAKIIQLSKEGVALQEQDISKYLNSQKSDSNQRTSPGKEDKLAIRVAASKKLVFPKTQGQVKYIESMNDFDIVFSIGPAGTGKTYLAMAMAVNFLMQKKVRRIILTRPAIEAGESLGFLPGDMHEKLSPYLRPLYDALYDMMEVDVIDDYLERGIIEIVPLAYMRGRTLNNAFIILDEAQNCSTEQLRMFLTRLGFDSKTVVTGDITQSDLPGGKPIGLIEARTILKAVKGIKFINLDKRDVVRHPLIQKIIQAYENFYDNQKS